MSYKILMRCVTLKSKTEDPRSPESKSVKQGIVNYSKTQSKITIWTVQDRVWAYLREGVLTACFTIIRCCALGRMWVFVIWGISWSFLGLKATVFPYVLVCFISRLHWTIKRTYPITMINWSISWKDDLMTLINTFVLIQFCQNCSCISLLWVNCV